MAAERYVAVVGPGDAGEQECAAAEAVGARLAELGAVVVTGGLGGVMEAACRGAKSRRGQTLGLLPGERREDANGWVDLAGATGLGEPRNGPIARASDAFIAIGASPGTLSEIALALRAGKPVIGMWTFELQGVEQVDAPAAAADRAVALSAQS